MRKLGGDEHVVAFLARRRFHCGCPGTGVLPDPELVVELGSLVVVRRGSPEIQLQRSEQPFLFLGLDGRDVAAGFVDDRHEVLSLEGDLGGILGEACGRGRCRRGRRRALAPRQRNLVPGDRHAGRVPGGWLREIISDPEEILAVRLGRVTRGDFKLSGLLGRDFRQRQFPFRNRRPVLHQFPRTVDRAHVSEEILVLNPDLHGGRADIHRRGVDVLIGLPDFLELRRRCQRGSDDSVAAERVVGRPVVEIATVCEEPLGLGLFRIFGEIQQQGGASRRFRRVPQR